MKTQGGKFGLVSSCQKLRCRVLFCVTTNWLCAKKNKKNHLPPKLLFMLIRPFYAYHCTSSFYAYWAFLCLSMPEMLQFMLIR
jgi:hypothetical protein